MKMAETESSSEEEEDEEDEEEDSFVQAPQPGKAGAARRRGDDSDGEVEYG